jgi:hypothetical protein
VLSATVKAVKRLCAKVSLASQSVVMFFCVRKNSKTHPIIALAIGLVSILQVWVFLAMATNSHSQKYPVERRKVVFKY